MARLGNIVQINDAKISENPYSSIHTFLERKGQNSENTKDTYHRAIRDFFRTMRNKELNQLNQDDLIFTKNQIETYQIKLRSNYKSTTVNTTISAIKECYVKLEDDGFNVSSRWFELERYDEHDKESYDTLTHEEVLQAVELVSKTRKGDEKSLMLRVAYATAFRRASIQSLTWNDMFEKNGIFYIKTLGKGNKWSYKKLSSSLYNEIIEYGKKCGRSGDEKIFILTSRTIRVMMDYIRENMNFGGRWIVFHSFKKASIDEVNIITGGDIKAMQRHGDHANAMTTLNDYLSNKDMEDLVEVDTDREIPVDKFSELSHNELLELVMSMDRNTKIKMLNQMGAI